jgi:hypothetical protein
MIASQQNTHEVTAKGLAIYNEKLKATLEPAHTNEYVAIHVDTGDFAVSKRRSEATRVMLSRYGTDGRLLAMKIGPEPEYGLAVRVFQTNPL